MQTVKVSKKAVPLADFIGGCGAGRLYCSLSPQGDVHPCVFLPVNVGNLKKEKFGDIWLNSKLFEGQVEPQGCLRQMQLQVHLRRLQGKSKRLQRRLSIF
jgi:MoaA/NifB/PqqE/SkfB family radical SAM enzyme